MNKKLLSYNPYLVKLASKLRNHSTKTEIMLWCELKKKKLKYDFHRQKPVGNFIVDFYSPALKLAIEIDGDSHLLRGKEDEARQKEIEKQGITFLRFDNDLVLYDLEKVVNTIEAWIKEHEK